jgi:hypothetical protein
MHLIAKLSRMDQTSISRISFSHIFDSKLPARRRNYVKKLDTRHGQMIGTAEIATWSYWNVTISFSTILCRGARRTRLEGPAIVLTVCQDFGDNDSKLGMALGHCRSDVLATSGSDC